MPGDVLATYGGDVLDVETFEDRYARAVGSRAIAAADSMGAYRDFLDRYVNFRLKVMAARDAGLAGDSAIVAEIGEYQKNLARPYMLEQAVIEPVVRDLFEKQQTIVDASHILIRVGPDASPADTMAAYQKLAAAIDSVEAGMPFADAATRFSEDPSAQGNGPGAQGALGYFSAGDMVDEFETMAYTTPVGQMSPIFRTRFGYHVLRVNDRKARPADARVAHIMIRPNGSDLAQLDSARQEAEALRARIAAGEDFAALAAQYSDDPGSAERGGELGQLTWRTNVVEPFKSVALALENEGEISDVTETQFGFHIIKLLEKLPAPTFEEQYSDLKSAAARMPRAQAAQNVLAERILSENSVRVDTAAVLAALAGGTLDTLAAHHRAGTLTGATQTVATIGTQAYTLDEFLTHVEGTRADANAADAGTIGTLLHRFVLEKAIDFESARLEDTDPEFGRIMSEFRDGLLLFRLMEDSVWNAAQTDSLALVDYYEAHRAEYTYPDRIRVVALNAPSDSVLTVLRARLDGGASFADLAADALDGVRIDTVLIADATNTIYDRALPLQEGAFVGPFPNRGTGRVLLYHAGVEAARPKTFEEARAEVTSQYQDTLDKQLIESLRARYDARIYPGNLPLVFSDASAASGGEAR